MRNRLLPLSIVVLLSIAGGIFFVLLKSDKGTNLTVVTWTGDYGHAQMAAQMTAFSRSTGAPVRFAVYDGGTAELARQVAARTVSWDVVDLELADAVAACRAGLLAKMPGPLPPAPGGRSANQDFLPGAMGPCWVATAVYSRVIAFDPKRFVGARPQRVTDFFDLVRFPGPRVLPETAKGTLELALLADGVPPAAVYRILSTPQGVRRALSKLDSIKSALVRPAAGESALSLLTSGRAAFALVLNGDLAEAAKSGTPLAAVWDGQQYAFDVLAIPKGAPHPTLAADYVRYATASETLAALASWLPYGPPRFSAVARVGLNPELKTSMMPWQPTTGDRMRGALAFDEAWWQSPAGAAAVQAWQSWRLR